MDSLDRARQQGHRLIQVGLLLFLAAMLVGLIVPRFALPRLGLSTHLLGLLQGILLIIAGLLWPRLRLTPALQKLTIVLLLYGCLAAWTANLSGAILGAGSTMLPLAAGSAHGSPVQEGLIVIGLKSAAVSLIAAVLLLLWGLRGLPSDPSR